MRSDPSLRQHPPSLDAPDATADRLEQWIRDQVADAGLERAVVNLSGGIDSTVTATVATAALGRDRITGLLLPTETNRSENIDDARQLARDLGIEHRTIELQPILDAFVTAVSSETHHQRGDPLAPRTATTTVPVKPRPGFNAAVGNTAARIRMAAAYFEANTTDALVLGTGNRTELLLGYFTKYGDGGVDLLPIGDLYKTEVRQLARSLGVDEHIIEKPPTAGLWAGQTDEDELGAPYEEIDTVLWNAVDVGADLEAVAAASSLPADRVDALWERHITSAHKRALPALPSETAGTDIIVRA